MVLDSTFGILSTVDTGAASDFSLGSDPFAVGSEARMDSESSQGLLSSAIVPSD